MNPTSALCAFGNTSHSCFSLPTSHQRILQVALSIILLAGITLSVLSIIGYLPHLAGYVSAPGGLLALTALILVTCATNQSIKSVSTGSSDKNEGITQKLDENKKNLDDGKLIVLEKSALQVTTKTVEGTGSGVCPIYHHDGLEYILKKNNTVEFYAGRLYKLILGKRSPNIIFIKDGNDFYAGSQFELTYHEIWSYRREKNALLEHDREGLAQIIVASFLLGEVDLKGLSSANSNIGIVDGDGASYYFKIDHEQSFLFGGEYWRANYVMDADWESKLWKLCTDNRLTEYVTPEDLKKAARKVASIPLQAFEEECDRCEKLCQEFPERLQGMIEGKTEDMLLESVDKPKIRNAVTKRIKQFQQLVLNQ